ncbi:MAG: hypothetical protein SV186_05080 [Candidatus Nanohaloarchaea archaeon]|nr:hypothetical protein [Candidatus Nanohaloarchaea archaeon]
MQLSVLKPSETATERFSVEQRPDTVNVAAVGCPAVRASASPGGARQ